MSLCLFASHGGRPDALLLSELQRRHERVHVLTTTPLPPGALPLGVTWEASENRNLDFGMHGRWLLEHDPRGLDLLTLANDSCDLVPGRALGALPPDLGDGAAWGLVKSYEIDEHLQGFLMAFPSPRAIAALHGFFEARRRIVTDAALCKDDVVRTFEVGLGRHLRGACGLRLRAAYDPAELSAEMAAARQAAPRRAPANLSYSYPDLLLARGCPLLKRNRQPDIHIKN